MSAMTIGRLARLGNVRADTIRHYERLRLVRPLRRSPSGYRLYDDEALLRLQFIKRAKAVGFSLEEIRKLLALNETHTANCEAMLEITEAKIEEMRRKISDLSRIRTILARLAKDCPGGMVAVSACPILEFLRMPKSQSDRAGRGS
jgi:MerR family transcriptional regulator, copper efflux regulator